VPYLYVSSSRRAKSGCARNRRRPFVSFWEALDAAEPAGGRPPRSSSSPIYTRAKSAKPFSHVIRPARLKARAARSTRFLDEGFGPCRRVGRGRARDRKAVDLLDPKRPARSSTAIDTGSDHPARLRPRRAWHIGTSVGKRSFATLMPEFSGARCHAGGNFRQSRGERFAMRPPRAR